MAIYIKHGYMIVNDSIHVDRSCYFDNKLLKVWGRTPFEGVTAEHQFFISHLKADNGKTEIDDVICAALKAR